MRPRLLWRWWNYWRNMPPNVLIKKELSRDPSSLYNHVGNWHFRTHGMSIGLLVTQSCPTLSDPMVCSPPGSSVHGIFQARILKWVAISFSRRSSRPRDWTRISCTVGRFFTNWVTRKPSVGLLPCRKGKKKKRERERERGRMVSSPSFRSTTFPQGPLLAEFNSSPVSKNKVWGSNCNIKKKKKKGQRSVSVQLRGNSHWHTVYSYNSKDHLQKSPIILTEEGGTVRRKRENRCILKSELKADVRRQEPSSFPNMWLKKQCNRPDWALTPSSPYSHTTLEASAFQNCKLSTWCWVCL